MMVVFRVDASKEIGSGHVMRCLTLADELASRKADCHFVIRQQSGDMIDLVEARGYRVHRLAEQVDDSSSPSRAGMVDGNIGLAHGHWLLGGAEQDAADTASVLGQLRPDWLVVDHYGIDRRWEAALVEFYGRLMVVDDLADREHVCDLLLDQNLGRKAGDYDGLVPERCLVLTGPAYALLRPEFREERAKSRACSREGEHLLINLGGVDKDNVTGDLLLALKACSLPENSRISVVMGRYAPWTQRVKEHAESMPWETHVLVGVDNMAELMASADVALGAAGGTSWERCCLGLPSILIVLADNQRPGAAALGEAGAALVGGTPEQSVSDLCQLLAEARSRRYDLALASSALCDGAGASRLANALAEFAT